jgi:hypothetical protein
MPFGISLSAKKYGVQFSKLQPLCDGMKPASAHGAAE